MKHSRNVIPFAVSCVAVLLAMLGKDRVIFCPHSYLNPWQYFFACSSFFFLVYALVAAIAFSAAYILLRLLQARRA